MHEAEPHILGIRIPDLKPEVQSCIAKLRASLKQIYDKYEVRNRDGLASMILEGKVEQRDADRAIELLKVINECGRSDRIPPKVADELAYYYPRDLDSIEFKKDYREVQKLETNIEISCLQVLPDSRILAGGVKQVDMKDENGSEILKPTSAIQIWYRRSDGKYGLQDELLSSDEEGVWLGRQPTT